jgi:hypothetical protein
MQSFIQLTNLSLKTPGTLEKTQKLAASNPWVIYEFHDILEELVGRLHLVNSSGNIWKVDETSFNLDPIGRKVISGIGDKTKRVISGCGKSSFTTIVALCWPCNVS